jgi:hypothetical protein
MAFLDSGERLPASDPDEQNSYDVEIVDESSYGDDHKDRQSTYTGSEERNRPQ